MLKRFFNVAGLSNIELDNKVSLTAPLDPERCKPYGPWVRAVAGYARQTIVAQPFSFFILNPATSGSVAVIEEFAVSQSLAGELAWAILTAPAVIPAGAPFVQVDDTDSSVSQCPLQWNFNLNLGASGQVLGNVEGLANTPYTGPTTNLPLYPGASLSCGFGAGVAAYQVAFYARIRFVSPVPV
jgi:hypothetical protein